MGNDLTAACSGKDRDAEVVPRLDLSGGPSGIVDAPPSTGDGVDGSIVDRRQSWATPSSRDRKKKGRKGGRKPSTLASMDPVQREGEKRLGELFTAGYALYDLHKCQDAIDKFTAALEVAKEFTAQAKTEAMRQRFRSYEGRALGNLASTHEYLCRFAEALESYEPCLEIMREINDREKEIKVLNNMGVATLNLNDFERSLEYHKQMYKRMKEPPAYNSHRLKQVKKRLRLIQDKMASPHHEASPGGAEAAAGGEGGGGGVGGSQGPPVSPLTVSPSSGE